MLAESQTSESRTDLSTYDRSTAAKRHRRGRAGRYIRGI
jgi:hypothetical protein